MDLPVPDASEAFVAICLAAVGSDGQLNRAESHSLRQQLDWRTPYHAMAETEMASLIDGLLKLWRQHGGEALVTWAVQGLTAPQRETALAVALELLAADRRLHPDEHRFIDSLTAAMRLPPERTAAIVEVMGLLHRDALAPGPAA
jgi:hypothetical protein